jgi:Tfp pilus assembly protein PilZ
MTDFAKHKSESTATAQLNKYAKDISLFAHNATEEQKEVLLRFLNDAQFVEVLQSWRHTDRRKAPRKPCSLTVHYAIEDQVMTQIIKNISTGGAFIETFAPLSVGQEITMTIWEEPIETTGKIVWTGPRGVGVEFTSPPSEALKKMIESL